MELAYRPAYHDLMARDVGYDKNSEIIFLDFKLRYYLESERLRLDQAKISLYYLAQSLRSLVCKTSVAAGRGDRHIQRIAIAAIAIPSRAAMEEVFPIVRIFFRPCCYFRLLM